jgi:hypothetical protein
VVVGAKKSSVNPSFVWMLVGNRAPTVCGNDGVQMLVSTHDTHNQTPHTDIIHKGELEKESSRV